MTNAPLLQLSGLRKSYNLGLPNAAEVLHGIDLRLEAGEFVALIGPSGSGKSTLLNILGLLEPATAGSYQLQGTEMAGLPDAALTLRRREAFGFVFQGYHLIATESASENVEMPAIYAGMSGEARARRAAALLERLGMGDKLHNRPNQLSGGQQQRVSIARALMNGGRIILADEPTGALDTQSGAEVMKILGELHAEGHTVIIVTHDMGVAAHAERVIEIRDGV
ncbi:MAG: ABC transporter ATP-binding protein, partial [Comamonas sp.]